MKNIKVTYNGKKYFAVGIAQNGKIKLSSVENGSPERYVTTPEVFLDKGNIGLIRKLFPKPY